MKVQNCFELEMMRDFCGRSSTSTSNFNKTAFYYKTKVFKNVFFLVLLFRFVILLCKVNTQVKYIPQHKYKPKETKTHKPG